MTEYLEGALPAERVELVEQHLVMCDWCKTYLEQLEATVRALPETAEPEPVSPETELVLLGAFREWKAGSESAHTSSCARAPSLLSAATAGRCP